MRRCALIGVGHDPKLYDAGPYSFSVEKLRTLRRKHFRDESAFAEIMCDTVVPYSEATVLGMAEVQPRQRALLGCSLSSLLALRTMLRPEQIFGQFICGSPSLHFVPQLVNDARAACREKASSPSHLLMVVGGFEERPLSEGGNEIPQASREMADVLRKGGHRVDPMLVLAGESHDSLKPALISRACGWLEQCWASPSVTSVTSVTSESVGEAGVLMATATEAAVAEDASTRHREHLAYIGVLAAGVVLGWCLRARTA